MTLRLFTFLGFLCTLLFGTLLHFTYEWSGYNSIIGSFSAVNESTWEHLKLLSIPTLIFTIIAYIYYRKEYNNILITSLIGINLGHFTIISLFYTYKGVIGQDLLLLDIFTFIIGCAITYLFFYFSIKNNWLETPFLSKVGGICLILLCLSFVLFTYYPPNIGLFAIP